MDDAIPHERVPRAKRLALPTALFGTGGLLAAMALLSWGTDRGLLFPAALFAFAGLGATRKGLIAQVGARATAWLTLVSTGLVSIVMLLDRSPLRETAVPLGIAAATAAALWLGRAALHTREAHAPFAPVRFRSAFIMASTANVATAIATALASAGAFSVGNYGAGFGVLALAAAMAGAAVGVLRMRGAGVALGAATSLATLLAAALLASPGLALLAVPGALLALPVLAARLAPDARAARTRVAVDAGAERVRVADGTAADELEAAPAGVGARSTAR